MELLIRYYVCPHCPTLYSEDEVQHCAICEKAIGECVQCILRYTFPVPALEEGGGDFYCCGFPCYLECCKRRQAIVADPTQASLLKAKPKLERKPRCTWCHIVYEEDGSMKKCENCGETYCPICVEKPMCLNFEGEPREEFCGQACYEMRAEQNYRKRNNIPRMETGISKYF